VIVRAKAPLRISFCGGGTDVSPYPEEHGGVVLSATVDKYAHASLRPIEAREVRVHALDRGLHHVYSLDAPFPKDGEHDLVTGVLDHFRRESGALPSGCEIYVQSDAPAGSGLGSSSTLVTTLVGVVSEWLRRPLTPYEVAERTYQIERIELGLAGGRQDQYAATFGGFNFMEFHADHTVVNPLRLRRDTWNELEYALTLCFTNVTRASAHIVESQTKNYREGHSDVVGALDAMKRMTLEMKALLLRGRVSDFGLALHQVWEEKKRLDSGITTPAIDALYAAARAEGATGGKILGAGGGGFLLCFSPFERRPAIARALTALGGQVVPFAFEGRGLQTWVVTE